MTIDELKDLVNEYIIENGIGAITGPILNNVLIQILDYLAEGGGGGGGVVVVDNLDSESATAALSANQGRILKGMIDSGTGINYQKVTQERYDELADAGELSENILYIIVG